MLKQYGVVGTRGRGPWVQGNNADFVFFSPDLEPLTHEGLNEVIPEPTAESQNSIRWVYTVIGGCSREKCAPIATQAMRKILERYPPKNTRALPIPWQLNVNTAVHFASYEDRRIVVAPVSSRLINSLQDSAALRKHVHNYAFLKADEADVSGKLREAMQQAGPDGLVIVERPEGRNSGTSPWQAMQVLGVLSGTQTSADVAQFLDRYARPAGWDAKLTLK